jgi:hypothetical protein
MNAEQTIVGLLIALGLVAALIDSLIPNKPGVWRSDTATVRDVASIVNGGKPAGEPRHALKLGLLLVAVLAAIFVLGR